MNATEAYEAGFDFVYVKTPVRIVMRVKTSHMSAMDHNRRGLRPTRAGRKANATEQAKENIEDVAVIRVWWNVEVIPTSSSIYLLLEP